MKCRTLSIPACAIMAAFSVSCVTSSYDEGEVGYHEVGRVNEVAYGQIESVAKVELVSSRRYEGALIGAGLGGIAGAVIGPGRAGSIAGGVIGAIAGGLAGRKVQAELRDDGYEYDIMLEDGSLVSVIEIHRRPIEPGQYVRLVYSGDTVRLEETGHAAVSRR